MKEHTVNLGDEFDVQLWKTLKEVIAELGGRSINQKWGIAGSQELETFEIELQGTVIRIASETYIGVTLVGDPFTVNKIQQLVVARMKS